MRGLKAHYEKMRALLAEHVLYRSEDESEWTLRWEDALATAHRKERLCETSELLDALDSHWRGLESQLALTLPVIQQMRGYATERGREDYTHTMRYRASLLEERERALALSAEHEFEVRRAA